jgi:uncharacterized protein
MSRRPIVEGLFTLDGAGGPRLLISKCRACGALAFPARKRCHACTADDLEATESPAEGTIYSWTVVRELGGPRPDFQPYVVAQVDLGTGLRVQGVVDASPDAVSIGQRVRMGFVHPFGQDLDSDVVTYCFVPVEGRTP